MLLEVWATLLLVHWKDNPDSVLGLKNFNFFSLLGVFWFYILVHFFFIKTLHTFFNLDTLNFDTYALNLVCVVISAVLLTIYLTRLGSHLRYWYYNVTSVINEVLIFILFIVLFSPPLLTYLYVNFIIIYMFTNYFINKVNPYKIHIFILAAYLSNFCWIVSTTNLVYNFVSLHNALSSALNEATVLAELSLLYTAVIIEGSLCLFNWNSATSFALLNFDYFKSISYIYLTFSHVICLYYSTAILFI